MQSIEGTVLFAQESRFQLLDTNGVGHHFILSHACAADPEQLPALQRDQAQVRVHYEIRKNILARIARRIDRVHP
jgi:hypothetical protein